MIFFILQNVIESHQQITEYRYDNKFHRWCNVVYELPLRNKTKLNVAGMVERVVGKAIVWKTPEIDKCVIREDQRNGKTIQILQTQKINVEVSTYLIQLMLNWYSTVPNLLNTLDIATHESSLSIFTQYFVVE